MDALGKTTSFIDIGLRSFAPEHVNIGRVNQSASNGSVQASFISEEAIVGAFAGQELNVADVAVTGEQLGAVGVSAGDQHRRNAADVRSKTRRNQLLHKFLRRYQDFAAQVSAFLG